MKYFVLIVSLLTSILILSGCSGARPDPYHPGAICERNDGEWLWSGATNQWYCTNSSLTEKVLDPNKRLKVLYAITYQADPRGASIICDGVNQGFAPQTLRYDFNSTVKESGIARTTQCFAKWISGAQMSYSQEWDLKQFPNSAIQTVQRPNVSGESIDIKYAQELDKKDYIASKDYISAYNKGLLTKDEVELYLLKDQTEAQQEQARVQQAYQKRQAEAAESTANTAAINSFNQSMNNLSNQMRQNTYDTQQSAYQVQQLNNQMYQQRQDKKINYQLQQINNNLNNIRYGY